MPEPIDLELFGAVRTFRPAFGGQWVLVLPLEQHVWLIQLGQEWEISAFGRNARGSTKEEAARRLDGLVAPLIDALSPALAVQLAAAQRRVADGSHCVDLASPDLTVCGLAIETPGLTFHDRRYVTCAVCRTGKPVPPPSDSRTKSSATARGA